MNRITKTCLLHSVTALGGGLLLYIFTRRHTYLHAVLGIPDVGWQSNLAITGWLGDFLWSYALCFAIYLIWQNTKIGIGIAVSVTIALGAELELLQKLGAIGGTFDILDIIAEAIAAFAAAIIIKRSISK